MLKAQSSAPVKRIDFTVSDLMDASGSTSRRIRKFTELHGALLLLSGKLPDHVDPPDSVLTWFGSTPRAYIDVTTAIIATHIMATAMTALRALCL